MCMCCLAVTVAIDAAVAVAMASNVLRKYRYSNTQELVLRIAQL